LLYAIFQEVGWVEFGRLESLKVLNVVNKITLSGVVRHDRWNWICSIFIKNVFTL